MLGIVLYCALGCHFGACFIAIFVGLNLVMLDLGWCSSWTFQFGAEVFRDGRVFAVGSCGAGACGAFVTYLVLRGRVHDVHLGCCAIGGESFSVANSFAWGSLVAHGQRHSVWVFFIIVLSLVLCGSCSSWRCLWCGSCSSSLTLTLSYFVWWLTGPLMVVASELAVSSSLWATSLSSCSSGAVVSHW